MSAATRVLRFMESAAHPGEIDSIATRAYVVHLILSGNDISTSNSRGNALSNAAFHGFAEAVGAVIGRLQCSACNAQLNIQNANGCSALMFAANGGHADVVAMLLVSGANVLLTDKLGCTAADRARKKGHHHIVAMIEKPQNNQDLARASVQVSVYRLFVLCHIKDSSTFNDLWLSSLDAAVLNATALYKPPNHHVPALYVAWDQKNLTMMRKLIASGADVNITLS